MARIAHLIAESLTPHERNALRQLGLGREDADEPIPESLCRLRLVDAAWPVRELALTSLGKQVLGEVILATGQYLPGAQNKSDQRQTA